MSFIDCINSKVEKNILDKDKAEAIKQEYQTLFDEYVKTLPKSKASRDSIEKVISNFENKMAKRKALISENVNNIYLQKAYNDYKTNLPVGEKAVDFKEFQFKQESLVTTPIGDLARVTKTSKYLNKINIINKINPIQRIASAKYSVKPKEVMQKLVKTGMLWNKNKLGIANAQSVEISRKQLLAGHTRWVKSHRELFLNFKRRIKKEGAKNELEASIKTIADFNEQVSFSARRKDQSIVPEIKQSASLLRNEVLTPLGNEAVKVEALKGLFDGKTADSYFHRMYNKQKVIANEDSLRARLVNKLKNVVVPSIQNEFTRKENNLNSLIIDLETQKIALQDILNKESDKLLKESAPEFDTQELIDILDRYKSATREVKSLKPKSLFQFIRENGGMVDYKGELKSLDINYKTLPGLLRKTDTGGNSLDYVREYVKEANYFPIHIEKPTINDFLDLIERESRGNKVYSNNDIDLILKKQNAEDIITEIESLGIDINKIESDLKLKSGKIQTEIRVKNEEGSSKLNQSNVKKISKLLTQKEIELLDKKISNLKKQFNSDQTSFNANLNSGGNIDAYIEEVADTIIGKLKKERYGYIDDNFIIAEKGALKNRTLSFMRDEELEDVLENDVEKVINHYAKSMSTDIELARAFKGDLTLKDAIDDVVRDYNEVAKGKSAKEKLKIQKEKQSVVRDLEALKDILRGYYATPDNPDSILVRAGVLLRTFNYITKMGQVTIASFSDIANPIAIHGMRRWAGAIKDLAFNTKAIKLNIEEAKLAGNIADKVMMERMSTFAELGDPFYNNQSSFERFIENTAKLQSKINLMPIWNDFMKGFSSVMTQQRIIKNLDTIENLSQNEISYLAFLGINKDNGKRILDQIKKFGENDGKLWIANTEKWEDLEAKRIYRNALNTDVDRTIVTMGAGDIPLVMNTQLGRVIGQFKSFAFASTQQILIGRLQQKDLAALTGLISAITMGMFSYYLKQTIAGKEISDDPKKLISEGLDRSGYLAILMEISNIADKAGMGLGSAFGGEVPSRYASRNLSSTFFGPSAGLVEDIFSTGRAISTGEFNESDIKAVRNMIPLNNNLFLTNIFNELEENLK